MMLSSQEVGQKRTREHDRAESASSTRLHASSSDPQPYLPVPRGVYFWSRMNKHHQFFVPSTKNYFDGLKIRKLHCDSGCNSMLLPILSTDMLVTLLNKYSTSGTSFQVVQGNGTGGKTLALRIQKGTGNSMGIGKFYEVNLCDDVLSGKCIIHVPFLRFHLCYEDVTHILGCTELKTLFTKADQEKMPGISPSITRRDQALVGQTILKNFSSTRHGGIEMYFDPDLYDYPRSKAHLEGQISSLAAQSTTLISTISDFDDWHEDNAVTYEDDEYDVESL